MTKRQPESLVGEIIDGYRILKIAGTGGMGVVFKAQNLALAKIVALKMIDPSLAANERFQQSFQSEARALARTDTSHIVRVYDLRRNEYGLFIVMEFVEGQTVADVLESHGGRMPWTDCLPIIKQALAALDHAHGVGVVHRDIKPRNLMIQESGEVKVTDFGLAKVERTDSESTVLEGEWEGGTIPYMAPEQVKGGEVDHRADIYAVGMTFYELLTGHRPFVKEDRFSSLEAMVREELPSPLEFVPKLPGRLVQIVLKATQKDPSKRYSTAGQMLEALENLDDADGGAKQAPFSKIGSRWPLVVTVAALVVIAVVYLLGTPEPSASALLTVTTAPPGATVLLNDAPIGRTPLSDVALEAATVEGSPLRLRLAASGYQPMDTLVDVREGLRTTVNVELTPLDATGRTRELVVSSQPDDAQVYVDGRDVGRTPLTIRVADALVAVRVEKNGYSPWEDELVPTEPGVSTRVNAVLRPVRQATTTAQITLQAVPDGAVSWRGRTGSGSETFVMPAGSQVVSFARGEATQDTTITVVAGTNNTVTCYFEHDIPVNSRLEGGDSPFVSATVSVNGENVGETPTTLRFGPGEYRIEVKKFGYETLDPDRNVVIRPAFERKSFPVVVTLREE